jgi:hypothetical protein
VSAIVASTLLPERAFYASAHHAIATFDHTAAHPRFVDKLARTSGSNDEHRHAETSRRLVIPECPKARSSRSMFLKKKTGFAFFVLSRASGVRPSACAAGL